MNFYLHTLGCPKNLVDAEEMASRLVDRGDRPVARAEDAEVIVLNTCGFLGAAREESLAAAAALASGKRPGQRLVVAGCLAERDPDAVRRVGGVDEVLGTKRIAEIARACHEGMPPGIQRPGALDLTQGWRRILGGPSAYLKIADGCDHVCTFCTIPSFKGPLRSKPIALVCAEAELLVAAGTRELVLVGQDTTDYGHELRDGTTLGDLLRALDERIGSRAWIRIMYAYPHHVNVALLRAMAECRSVLPYLDVPLQHAHTDTLRRMKRGGSVAWHLDLVRRIRMAVPGLTLRSTFIVGFPGETEAEFATLLRFLEEARIDHAGFFAYSQEDGTPAGAMADQVAEDVKAERLARAQETQTRIGRDSNRATIGGIEEVLVERQAGRWISGRTAREAPEVDGEVHVRVEGPPPPVGALVRARITSASAVARRASLA